MGGFCQGRGSMLLDGGEEAAEVGKKYGEIERGT
jgi:hypothetical protein